MSIPITKSKIRLSDELKLDTIHKNKLNTSISTYITKKENINKTVLKKSIIEYYNNIKKKEKKLKTKTNINEIKKIIVEILKSSRKSISTLKSNALNVENSILIIDLTKFIKNDTVDKILTTTTTTTLNDKFILFKTIINDSNYIIKKITDKLKNKVKPFLIYKKEFNNFVFIYMNYNNKDIFLRYDKSLSTKNI